MNSIKSFNKSDYDEMMNGYANRAESAMNGIKVTGGYSDFEQSTIYLETDGRLTQEIANKVATEFRVPVPVYNGASGGDMIAIKV